MNFNEYQEAARRTSGVTSKYLTQHSVQMAALGLSGEVGELNDHIKKAYYHGHPLSLAKIVEEVGDILWYIAEMCSANGLELEDIAIENVEKLKRRYPEGFSSEASKNRVE